jgi:hypothetical protein
MINNPSELWEEKLNNVFKKKDKTEIEMFLDIVSLILYNNNNQIISGLYSILSLDDFIKVINLLSGETVKFPCKEEVKEAIELALIFYYKNIKGMTSYKDIKALNIIEEKDFSSISIGKKLNKLTSELQEKILNMYLDMENSNETRN